jgi:hypothetical protein
MAMFKKTQSSHAGIGNHGNENIFQIEYQSRSLTNVINENSHDGIHYIKRHCGKLCNGNRGLRAHKRFCQVNDVPELANLFEHDMEQLQDSIIESNDEKFINNRIKRLPKQGIKLPKTTVEWDIANDFFKVNLGYNGEIEDVNTVIKNVQNTIYDYFANNYGTVGGESACLKQRYDKLSKRQLKKELRNLKNENNLNNTREIRYISRLIRVKYSKTANTVDRDHNIEIKENFWQYCKNTFEKPKDNTKPDFDEKRCRDYFKKHFKKNSKPNYDFPSWMKMLNEPKETFNNEPPSY